MKYWGFNMLSKYFSLTVCNISSSFQLMVCLFFKTMQICLLHTHAHTKAFRKHHSLFQYYCHVKHFSSVWQEHRSQYGLIKIANYIWTKKTKKTYCLWLYKYSATDLLFYPLCAKSIVESLDSFWKNTYSTCYLIQTYFVLWMFCQIL